jgi:hypothetical protein
MSFITKISNAQIEIKAKNLADTVISKLIVDDIPKKTFKDKLMYPHRWYVKQLLRPKITDFDTSYITNSKRRLTITIPISKKYYGFNIDDLNAKKKLNYSPNTYYNVGFNFSNIILTFGFVPALKLGARQGRGNTKSVDFQLTIIGRRVITDVNYQNYKGFYVHNSNDFKLNYQDPEVIIIRPDIKVISYGVNTMFVYNYKKYSLRGAFSFTDVQRKSAASFMTGIYHSHVVFSSSDSAFVKYPIRSYFSPLLNEINRISVISVGVSGGYGYTFVHKKILFSTAVNVGLGGQKTNYTTIDNNGHSLPLSLSIHVNAKAALRYDNIKFFTGVLATYDTNYSPITKNFNTDSYISRVVLFVGYRFNIKRNGRKLLKAMGLIDYNVK